MGRQISRRKYIARSRDTFSIYVKMQRDVDRMDTNAYDFFYPFEGKIYKTSHNTSGVFPMQTTAIRVEGYSKLKDFAERKKIKNSYPV
ncbi:MAG TPA: hypothetical protein VJ485_00945 [archaeon]|jgi:hypothetical protein|nr:hypothetical protein [archaeon]